jgi:hypothetical protein
VTKLSRILTNIKYIESIWDLLKFLWLFWLPRCGALNLEMLAATGRRVAGNFDFIIKLGIICKSFGGVRRYRTQCMETLKTILPLNFLPENEKKNYILLP